MILDLPDGAAIAATVDQPPVYVQLRPERIVGKPAVASPHHLERVCQETGRYDAPTEDVPVVATSLAELLSRALDTEGSTDLPTLRTLREQFDLRWRTPT